MGEKKMYRALCPECRGHGGFAWLEDWERMNCNICQGSGFVWTDEPTPNRSHAMSEGNGRYEIKQWTDYERDEEIVEVVGPTCMRIRNISDYAEALNAAHKAGVEEERKRWVKTLERLGLMGDVKVADVM